MMNWYDFFKVTVCACACCLAGHLYADEPGGLDPDVPGPFDPSLAAPLLERPPFTRALNLSDNLLLTGVAYVDGKPVATIKDASTNMNYVVSEEPNSLGWRLASATPSTRLERAEVKVMIGSEIIAVRYSDTQMMPQKKNSGSGSSRSSGGYSPTNPPSNNDVMGHDEKGEYVRASPYLSEDDRNKMRSMPSDVRQKFLDVVHDNREKMFRYSPDQRAAFVKKVFDGITRGK